ncbi:DinB family protein [Maribacter sp. 2-571]|uniref:DinB family protein n=1 Tax=Maribacter sp. 2-571 TaxID=3417569 RepID=UPI003D34402D
MNEVALLVRQTTDAYSWVHKLIDPVPEDLWGKVPKVLESSINWQVGHIILSTYYHSILVVTGHQRDVLEHLPLKKYNQLYAFKTSPANTTEALPTSLLHEHLDFIEKKSIAVISSLDQKDLSSALVPGKVEHPIAKNKYKAVDWNIKHTMWHCGQLATLRRVLGNTYDFGLSQPGQNTNN